MSQEKILAPGYGDKITCPCDFFFYLQRGAVLIHNKTIVCFLYLLVEPLVKLVVA